MLRKVVRTRSLQTDTSAEELAFWLGRPPEERVGAVEILRRQAHAGTLRLQRVVRVIALSTDRSEPEALGED